MLQKKNRNFFKNQNKDSKNSNLNQLIKSEINESISETSIKKKEITFHKFYINNHIKNKKEYKHKNNYISTTKYNVFTFLPKSLVLQFTRLPNIYFLIIAIIQSIPSISPLTSITAILPFVFVLSVSMLRELIEDISRYKYDKQSNEYKVKLIKENNIIETTSSQIEVGDILIIKENEEFPCDMIILDSTNKGGVCYIETGSLDGEKNLKTKYADKALKNQFYINSNKNDNSKNRVKINELKNYQNISGVIECDKPNPELYNFNGKMSFSYIKGTDDYVLSINQLLLKGALLRQTKEVLGICVYTGKNNKILLNTKSHIFKTSRLENLMNFLLIFIFILELLLCVICAIYNHKYISSHRSFYDNFIFQGNILNKFKDESFLSFFTYLLLLNTMIPISLIVTIEIVKVIQGFFIGFDCELYSFAKNKFCKANAVSIIEELGKIDYIFSDKTGTLTCNKMVFKFYIINNSCYQYIRDTDNKQNNDVEESIRIPVKIAENNEIDVFNLQLSSSENNQNKEHNDNELDNSNLKLMNNNYNNEDNDVYTILKKKQKQLKPIKIGKNYIISHLPIINNKLLLEHEYFYCLALGNEVIPINNKKTNGIDYTGLSPDDIELVKAAGAQGFTLIDSNHDYKLLKVGEQIEKYEILNLFGFTSERKRMSIIVKCPNGTIKMYIKGADMEIKKRLKLGQNKLNYNTAVDCSEYFSKRGFRNLFLAMKEIKNEDYNIFANKLKECELNLENKQKLVNKCINAMENDYTLLGATIVEDKLQDNVPSTIKNLRMAGIKIWMLTGDKIDTAENISLSCNLISHSQKTFKIYPLTKKENKNYNKSFQKECSYRSTCIIPELDAFFVELNTFLNDNKTSSKKYSILVESSILSKIFLSDNKTKQFLEAALKAESVICCRVSPLQKSQVVQKVKNINKKAVTLAIGDGGNDVSMILEAHVGVGIHGEEGVLAVQSSDFSIGEFQYLNRLLFFHGRNSLNRTGNMINYFFYKNFVFTVIQFYFCFYNIGSGQTLIDDWFITLYNLVFTSLPLATQALTNFDVLENDSELSHLLMPKLYNETKKNGSFTIFSFCFTICKALLYSVLNFFITFYSVNESAINNSGNYADIWSNNVSLYTVIIYSISFTLIFKQTYIIFLFVAIIFVSSWILYTLFLIIAENSVIFNSSGAIKKTITSGKFYLNFLLIVGISFILDYAEHTYDYIFSNKLYTLLMQNRKEHDNLKLTEKIRNEVQNMKSSFIVNEKTKDKHSENLLLNEDNISENESNYKINNNIIIQSNYDEDNKKYVNKNIIKKPSNVIIHNQIIIHKNTKLIQKNIYNSYKCTKNWDQTEINIPKTIIKSKTFFKSVE